MRVRRGDVLISKFEPRIENVVVSASGDTIEIRQGDGTRAILYKQFLEGYFTRPLGPDRPTGIDIDVSLSDMKSYYIVSIDSPWFQYSWSHDKALGEEKMEQDIERVWKHCVEQRRRYG